MLKSRLMQLQVLFLLVLCGLLQYVLWFSNTGLVSSWGLHVLTVQQKEANKQVSALNGSMVADIQGLRHGNEAIEERARYDLGMVKKNETYYQVVKAESAAENAK